MSNGLYIMICETFKREVEAVFKSDVDLFKNVKLVTYPAAKLHLRRGWEEIVKKVSACGENCTIVLLGGACHVGLGDLPKELESCRYHSNHQCFDLFLSKALIKLYVEQGAYLVTPGWLKSWKEHIKEYDWEEKTTTEIFKSSTKKLLLFDTGVYGELQNDLSEFSEYIGLPYERLPVGLDFLSLLLKEIVIEWQLKESKPNSKNNGNTLGGGVLLNTFKIETKPSIRANDKYQVMLLFMEWDDKIGPMVKTYFPKEPYVHRIIENVGCQLFSGVESIYGQDRIEKGEGILLSIENIGQKGYVFFDSLYDIDTRGRERPFMLGVIAPSITYYESLRIKAFLKGIAEDIKNKSDWDIKNCWDRVIQILSTPIM